MLKRLRNQQGMTIIEILVAGILTLIVGGVALEFYASQHNQWLAQTDVSDMQQNVRTLLDELTTNIRSAGYGIMTGHPRIQLTSNTLTLFYKDSTKIDTIQYYVSHTDSLHPNLVKKINQGTPQIFAENIESIQFIRSGNIVTVTLVAREGRKDPEYALDGYRRRTLTADIELRNGV
jgi:type II secretory pathway pseudopilin PulG